MGTTSNFGRVSRSPSFKFFLLAILVLLISIPLAVVWLMLSDRQERAASVQREIAQDWGNAQSIAGPYLVVPYIVKVKSVDSGKQVEIEQERYAVFLPDTFNASADVKTEIRHRSIYDATVYQSSVVLEGRFPAANVSAVDSDALDVRWQDAFIALAISDVSGLKNNVQLETDGRTIAFEPSIGVANPQMSYVPGIHAPLGGGLARSEGAGGEQLSPQTQLSYKIVLALNGSSSLSFAPVGHDSAVSVKSSWPHPSFTGFLPASREIGSGGFSAAWRVPHLARNVPQTWFNTRSQLSLDRFTNTNLGVNLYVPVDFYSLVNRALKYGFMFIAVVFGGVFVMELLSRKRMHPIQYLFTGLALVIFYVLLLSLSEHIGFAPAYAAAAVATGGMISIYVAKALRSARRGATMAALFAVLFGPLYLILQLEDYALLAGALAGFVLLTATMFATLRVNWSGEDPQPSSP